MKNMKILKSGVILAVAASSTLAIADTDFSHRDVFASELVSATPINTNNSPIIAGMNASIAQLVDLTGSSSQAAHSGLQLFDTLGSSDLSPSVNFGSAFDSSVTGASYGSHQVDPTLIQDKFAPAIVPLPSAVFAGMGMLVGFAGIRYMRTRK